ncbi:hypothetical protein B0O99DRAFT_713259 [Bisporella sp. PMI_857]|nr:hypothetical protein B0O99DRAFT_713259 [Bisporella sp. PMI_857]
MSSLFNKMNSILLITIMLMSSSPLALALDTRTPPAPYSGPIIDFQTHALKPNYANSTAQSILASPAIQGSTADDILYRIIPGLADNLTSPARIAALGKNNVHVVTVNTFFPPLPATALIAAANEINEWMAQRVATQRRMIGFATIPSPPALAKQDAANGTTKYAQQGVQVLRRAITELGLKGVLFASNYENVFLGDPSFQPYFALAAELNIPVLVHPAVQPVEQPFINRKNIPAYTGYLDDQRTTLLDLIMAGTLENYPYLKLIVTHLAGGVLTSLGRLRHLMGIWPADPWYIDLTGNKRVLPHPIKYYFQKVYYDCNNAELEDLKLYSSVVGPDRLLTGTDFPWTNDIFSREVLGRVDRRLQGKLAYNNGAKLLGLPTLPL